MTTEEDGGGWRRKEEDGGWKKEEGDEGDPWVLAFIGLSGTHIFKYNTARRSQALALSLSLPPFPLSSLLFCSLSFFRFSSALLHVLCQQVLIQCRVLPLLRRFQKLPHKEGRHGEAQVLDGCHQPVRRAEQVHCAQFTMYRVPCLLPCTVLPCTVYRVPCTIVVKWGASE